MTKRTLANVVILRAGAAGVYSYLRLYKKYRDDRNINITFINDKDEFVFVPLIHEVATGVLPPAGVTQPIRTLPASISSRFIEGRVESVDLDRKLVRVIRKNYSGDHREIKSDTEREVVPY